MIKKAVIDLGSNTFHLLIVEISGDKKFEAIYRKRVFTGLSDGGIKTIKNEKIDLGLSTLHEFKKTLDQYGNPELRVIGTAVLRQAENRHLFIDKATKILNTPIEIIDGHQEADYIFKGITLLDDFNTGTHLVMDIGGGSTEFILIKNGEKIWSKSYLLGVGVLHELFHKSEPISEHELSLMNSHILHTLSDLNFMIEKFKPTTLAGASGSFEVLQTMVGLDPENIKATLVAPDMFYTICNRIVSSDENQRSKIEGLPIERVKLIVVGMALKKIICDMVQPEKIIVSPYALKEGVLREMISLDI